jgi:hypothetical protein
LTGSAVLDIPYERQRDPASNRSCGAAALCMVYRSLGINCSQAELTAKLTRPEPYANPGARTFLLAQDALALGLSAVVLRAKDPLKTLQTCRNHSLRAILNHRPRPQSANGHFTVLVDFAGDNVVVHDPLAGPNTPIRASDLLQLWQPLGGASEITGNVLVVLARDQDSGAPCPKCGSAIPDSIACPGCRQAIPLRPASVLGCMSPSCSARAWDALFCPLCDAVLTATPGIEFGSPRATKSGQPASAASAKPDEIDDDPNKIKSWSAEIDKFLAVLLSVNDGRLVPGAEPYFATIRQSQTELLDFQIKHAAELRAKDAQPPPAAAPVTVPQPPPPPVSPEPPPRPPVDWNVLARKLVEEIGYRPR